jgi:hypothetical protein
VIIPDHLGDVPEDVLDLKLEAMVSLQATQTNPNLLRSFFRAARLRL